MAEEVLTVLPVDMVEVHSVAEEMAKAFRNRVHYYIREYKLPPTDALEKAHAERSNQDWIEQIQETPSTELSWGQFSDLMHLDPDLGWQKWESVKAEAQEHYQKGMLAANAVQTGEPWQRARFYAIRTDLMRDWQPQNGIEQCLIDQLAICYERFLSWQSALNNWMEWTGYTKQPPDNLPRLNAAEALERSAQMIERFNRMFLRLLRALRDLRRYNTPVIVQNAGQVNVGAQQVNVAQAAEPSK